MRVRAGVRASARKQGIQIEKKTTHEENHFFTIFSFGEHIAAGAISKEQQEIIDGKKKKEGH